MNGIIYMRTSPHGNKYIGQTVKQESVRWQQHVKDSKSKRGDFRSRTPLSCAIRKFGADAFTVTILESGIQTEEELNEREEYWIRYYRTRVNDGEGGLNLTKGGLGHRIYTDDDFVGLYKAGYGLKEIANITGASITTIKNTIQTDK